MTCSGALINSSASSTITVMHKQQGHMHVSNNLHIFEIKVLIFLIFSFSQIQAHVYISQVKKSHQPQPREHQNQNHMVILHIEDATEKLIMYSELKHLMGKREREKDECVTQRSTQ